MDRGLSRGWVRRRPIRSIPPHFSRRTWLSRYLNVSILDFSGDKDDDGGGDDNCSYKTCKAPVKLSPPTNQHILFYRPDAFPVAQPECRSTEGRKICELVAGMTSWTIAKVSAYRDSFVFDRCGSAHRRATYTRWAWETWRLSWWLPATQTASMTSPFRSTHAQHLNTLDGLIYHP